MDGVGSDLLLAGALGASAGSGRAEVASFMSGEVQNATAAAGSRAAESAFPYLLDFAKWPIAFWGFQTRTSGTQQHRARVSHPVCHRRLTLDPLFRRHRELLRRRRWDVACSEWVSAPVLCC